MALNLSKNEESLHRAAKAVVDDSSPTNWTIFGYEGQSNTLQVTATGDGGLEEMVDSLSTGSCMYAFCRVKDPKTTLFKYVLIIWQGEGAPDTRRGVCSAHIRPVTALFKGINLTLTARTEDEVEPAVILAKVSNASSSKFDFDSSQRSTSPPPAPVGSVYKKTVPSVEMSITKEREQFWQQQERDDGQRQQLEASRQKVQHDQPIQNAYPTDKAQVIVPPKPARLAQAVADSKKPNYVDLERQKWEQTQKGADKNSGVRKPSLIEQRKASFDGPKNMPPTAAKPVSGKFTDSASAVGKKGFDPVASNRAEEERRRFDQAQRDSETEERERRLKAETMRQERLKEAQQLISGRGTQEEPAVMANKTRLPGQTANGAKPRSASNAAEDVALKAYREEERRKFEQTQKESETDERERRMRSEALRQERLKELAGLASKKDEFEQQSLKESESDERERRLRSEALRQERLRELAIVTQKKDAPVDDTFQSIGQSLKDKKQSTLKKGEDPEVIARRKEEQRRWEEAQRETQAEEQERRTRADALRQERAQEAAALIGGRSTASKAKSIFEQPSESPANAEPHRASANKVAKNLFETAPIGKAVHHPSASHHQHHEEHEPVHHHQTSVRDRKLLADEEELHKVEAERKNSVDSNDASHVPRPALHDSDHESHNHGRSSTLHDNSSHDDYLPSPPPYHAEDEEEIDRLSDSFRHGASVKPDHLVKQQENSPARPKDTPAVSPPASALNAWKAGLPVRPPSDDEADADHDDWNDHSHAPRLLSPTAGSSSGGSEHGGLRARALYDYQAADETEISFDPGDIITQIDKVDSGWYQGLAVNGTYGLFPANYVEMIS